MRRTFLGMVVVLALVVLGAGCGDGSGSGSASGSGSGSASAPADGDGPAAFAEDDADTVVHVRAVEWAFALDRTDADGPKVFFEVANEGEEKHEFEVLDADGEAVDEIEAFEPGEEKTLAVELEAGTYTLQCLVEKDGKTHADLGMKTAFEVR